MNNLLKFGLFGLALFGFYTVTIGRTLKRLEIYFEDLGQLKIKDGLMYLYVSLGVENPNKQNITINEINFDIYQDGKNVGRITKYDADITIAGRTRRSIKNIRGRVNLIQLVSNYIKLFSGQSDEKEFQLQGYLKAGNMTIPVKKTILA